MSDQSNEFEKARPIVPVPTLRALDGEANGRVLRLEQDAATLGRRPSNDYVLSDSSVSRVHARITQEAGAVIVTDLGSSGGTKVNDTEVVGATTVTHGDRITFGAVTMVLEDPTQIDTGEQPTEVFEAPPVNTGPHLSPRQRQVLELIAEGLTNSEIGAELGITERTVKAYTSELYQKLDASNRASAVAEAVKQGFL